MDLLDLILSMFWIDLLLGEKKSLKKIAALCGVVGLSLVGLMLFYGAGSVDDPNGYLVLAFMSFIAALGLLILLIVWRIPEIRAESQLLPAKPETARALIEQLRSQGKLIQTDFHLASANLDEADLQGIDLHRANLGMTGLERANLKGANLCRTNLRSARLEEANLCEADLRYANLVYARLNGADLRDSCLDYADFGITDLTGAQLQGASIYHTRFVDSTLPDGCCWTPTTDMARFGCITKRRTRSS